MVDSSQLAIAIVCFGNPEHYSHILDTFRILSESFRVIVMARNVGTFDYTYPKNVSVFKIGRYLRRGCSNEPLYRRILERLVFILKTWLVVRKEQVSLLLVYDMHALLAVWTVLKFLKKLPVFYHQNETSLLAEIPKSRPAYWIKRLELRLARSAQILSFPEPNRARLFLKDAGLERDVVIIENCPMKLMEIPYCAPQMQDLKLQGHRIVIYQGVIGVGIDIHQTIRSMKFWPEDSVLVILGWRTKEEEDACKELAQQVGLTNRVIFMPFVRTREELFAYTAAAEIGLVLYRPTEVNRKFVAPTKLYEYLACGVPVVVPRALPYISEMVTRLGVGLSYLESTPEAIGKSIRELLDHPERKAMADRAREEHLSRLNFENQFSPLLEAIRHALR